MDSAHVANEPMNQFTVLRNIHDSDAHGPA